MSKCARLLFLISALSTTALYAQEAKIEAFKAPFYVGQSVMACGKLVETKHLSNRHYLNLDKAYPNQTLTLLVWDTDYRWFEERFGKIDAMIGQRFCARGTIEEYKNNMQLKIKNPQFLRLMK
ncbi:hypothetical protein EC844_101266 [Acinetobacter calcoaceticus]|uniref:Uncharacterized protein n=1 Tax=Acinetobacter calcoaceticus TaxID=471 RepID=A0A4R1Y6X2_ACICA|nr:hypothetical protein EC844_101266 [Acinetobacter calcoaceticus]